ncbi:MAG: hypothetical protein HZB29_04025 [Nitrospinae bacterium]|nr:hypothetical protein [Nitrospinota bacterium]
MKRVSLLMALAIAAALTAAAYGQAGDKPGAGETLFKERCAVCHALPYPQALSRAQWEVALKTMNKRLARKGMATLTEEETATLKSYFMSMQGK